MNPPCESRLKPILATICVLALAADAAASDDAPARVLSDADWRADIEAAAAAIHEFHPRPFRTTSAAAFQEQFDALMVDVPGLADKEVVVRLASLVALIDDGHTRLSIPRQHPAIGLEFGHTPTPGPDNAMLEFRQLPVAFEKFDDGIFIIATREDLKGLIGYRLDAMDGTNADDALAAVQAITYAENSQLEALMGVDRLSLPEALAALGISRSAREVTLALVSPDGVRSQELIAAMDSGPFTWIDAFADQPVQLRSKHAGKKFWSEYVPTENFVYMQMDEIADDDVSMAEFVNSCLQMAVEKKARLVIDIRNNFGGSGGLNKTLVMSIIQNNELNQHDRTFVLIGRRTFSAAQMLVNELEQYTRVTFIGEPTGSRPDHYGDPKKIRLENSGLTLRVSRLHWSSYTAFDEREATHPDFLTTWTSAAYFGGQDPALDLALSLEDVDLKALLRRSIPRGDLVQIGRYLLDSKRAPDTYSEDFSAVLLELGIEFEQAGDKDSASLAFQVGLYFYPEHEELSSALAALDSAAD
jgi:hypothetical protein